jgi:hypothetical protein
MLGAGHVAGEPGCSDDRRPGTLRLEHLDLPGYLAQRLRRGLHDVLRDLEREMRNGGMQLEELD